MNTLARYPYVVVRISCEPCRRKGAFRLARLAEKYGADASLDSVLDALTGDCPRLWDPPRRTMRKVQRSEKGICFARLVDLDGAPRPTDLPPAARILRLVTGGKKSENE